MSTQLRNIVTDWGGFEEFVKEIHKNDDVTVERNVKLTGTSGASRQIDVHVTHKKGPYIYSTLIECKHWKKRVKRQQVENLYASMDDLNAAKGVIFTTIGYQSGAETYAKAKNIEIFVIRDLKEEEWGKPGKIIEFYVQMFSKTILNIDCQNTMAAAPVGTTASLKQELSLKLGSPTTDSQNIKAINQKTKKVETIVVPENQILSSHKKRGETLEKYLEGAASHGLQEIVKKDFLINDGEDCIRYMQIDVNMPFKEKGELLQVVSKGQLVIIPKIVMEVGIKINQFKIKHDRSSNLVYALAVEDCISGNTFAVSKKGEDSSTNWNTLMKNPVKSSDDVLINGSIMKVTTSGFFDPNEVSGLKEVELMIK
ncbi:restriction endonuclease [bacterium]|nr:restriction endonuclease [bacterium]